VSSPVARKADIQKKLKIALDETQMLIMGVQILIGFQLQHAIGLGMMTLAIVLLLAPAAFHRLAFAGEDTPIVHKIGSIFVTAALAALALGLGAEVMVAIGALSGRLDIGALMAAIVLVVLVGLWYVWPLAIRARRHGPTRRPSR
jgi:Family of unknown function (DUF6328)